MIFVNGDTFGYMPNWTDHVNISYNMQTIISETRDLKEQRKPLQEYFQLGVEAKFLCGSADKKATFENYFKYYKDDGFYIPVYPEPLRIDETGSIATKSTINTNNSQYYYMLRNQAEYVMLYDQEETVQVEKKEIDSVGDTSITFTSAVSAAFDGSTVLLFPLIKCILQSKSIEDLTDDKQVYTLNFKELL